MNHSYRKNRSLLFQFLLSEFFASYKICLKLSLTQPEKLLELLSGPHPNYMRIFAWTQDDGSLTRLRNYAALLHETSKEVEIFELTKKASRTWEVSLKTLDKLRTGGEIEKTLEKLELLMKSLQKAIFKCLPLFKEDENTLYFIIRHADQFESCFGERTIRKLLKKLFPDGLKEAEKYLCDQFALRQHNHLIAEIQETFAHL